MLQKSAPTTAIFPNQSNMQREQGQLDSNVRGKAGRKRVGHAKEINIIYLNELIPGAFEKALAEVFADKVKNNTLNVRYE